jgi:dihydrofolate reductase
VSGDAVDVVARLKEESEVPLRSHGSLSMNRALMAAGLVDRIQVTLFPVITGQTGLDPIFQGAADFRPGAGRESDARRSHPRAHLPTQPSLTCQSSYQRSTNHVTRPRPELLHLA